MKTIELSMGRPYDISYPRGHAGTGSDRVRRAQRWLRPVLVPASWLYRCASESVRRVRGLDLAPTPGAVTVVSVGGIEAGGSGKTPLGLHLIERLRAEGERVAYVSRGYRSRAERFSGVTVVAEPGTGVDASNRAVRWLRAEGPGLAREIGDEGAMIARRVHGVALAFARDKAQAVAAVAPCVRGGYIILDDAFQSWGVARDVDVVIVDTAASVDGGWLLPAGSLREEPDALARADIVLVDGADAEAAVAAAAESLAPYLSPGAVVGGMARSTEFTDVKGTVGEAPHRAVVVSAIARPEGFESSLTGQGIDIVKALRFPDHYAFTAADAERIRDACVSSAVLITTEKDWVKLVDFDLDGVEVTLARLRLRIVGEVVYEGIRKPRA